MQDRGVDMNQIIETKKEIKETTPTFHIEINTLNEKIEDLECEVEVFEHKIEVARESGKNKSQKTIKSIIAKITTMENKVKKMNREILESEITRDVIFEKHKDEIEKAMEADD